MTRPKSGGLSRPGSKARRTQDAVLKLPGEHARQEFGLPTSARLIFYELESAGLTAKPSPNDERRHRRPVCRLATGRAGCHRRGDRPSRGWRDPRYAITDAAIRRACKDAQRAKRGAWLSRQVVRAARGGLPRRYLDKRASWAVSGGNPAAR